MSHLSWHNKHLRFFYVKDVASKHWYVVLQGKKKQIDVNIKNLSNLHIVDIHLFKTMVNFDEDALVDDEHATQEDHCEGI